jgi:hypothetical protein
MRVKVVSVFRDKYTNKKYKLGEKIDVSAERYNEIKQFVEVIKTKKGQE